MHPLLPKMELVELEIDKITIFDSNPRQHDDKQLDMLEKSFRSFQKINPFIVTPKYELIAGEARLIVATRSMLTISSSRPTIAPESDVSKTSATHSLKSKHICLL
jgi:hypothetical protein